MRLLIALLLALMAAPVSAQVAPGIFTTLKTTDTTANSLLVGCAVGSSTCTGGIKSGPVVATTGTFSGAVQVTGGSAAVGTMRFGSNTLIFQGGTSGYQWNSSAAGSLATLSDAGALSVPNVGTHVFGGGGTVTNSIIRLNGGSGTGIGGYIQLQRNGTQSALIGDRAGLTASGTSADLILFAETSNAIGFMTNGSTTQKFGINANGDWLKGSNIMDSTGTPTVASGFRTGNSISGNDYAFTIQVGTSGGAATSGVVNFGRTWTNTPHCVAQSYFSDVTPAVMASAVAVATTTQAQISFTSTSSNFMVITVLCRGV